MTSQSDFLRRRPANRPANNTRRVRSRTAANNIPGVRSGRTLEGPPAFRPDHDYGARLTFAQLQDATSPPPETHFPRISHTTAFDANRLILVDVNGVHHTTSTSSTTSDLLPPIQIINSDAGAAYSFCKLIAKLDRHKICGDIWGEVWSCVKYTRIRWETYQAPEPGKFVAIKKLNKRVVDSYLKARGMDGIDPTLPQEDLRHIDETYISRVISISDRENPYREMSRMDEFGDNQFVLKQIEFLQDDDFVYIVMPHACNLGSLDKVIFNRQYPMTCAEAKVIFLKILGILKFLERKKIHHRDISPDNFIFLEPDCLVLMDFAMSVRIPVDSETGQRTLILRNGRCGTPPFMAPEVYNVDDRVLDGVSVDLWAAVLILYCMLTKKLLYRQPNANMDIAFRYFILAGAIMQDPINERMVEVMSEMPEQNALLALDVTNKGLPADAQEIFRHVLRCNPSERWTLHQVLQCSFCTRPQA